MTQNIQDSGLKALVVHAPMDRCFNLDGMGNDSAKEKYRLVSQLATNLYQVHYQQMVVVIHQELSMDQLRDYGLIDGIEQTFSELLREFPNIEYALENLTLIGYEDGKLISRNSQYDETVKVANYLREKLNTERIGTTLDTCHMIGTIRLMDELSKFGFKNTIGILDFFNANKNILKAIHLANANRLGFGSEHGTIFETVSDKMVLKEILEHIESINYNYAITLEVIENPHHLAVNYSKMIPILKEFNIHNL